MVDGMGTLSVGRRLDGPRRLAMIVLAISIASAGIAWAKPRGMDFSISGPWTKFESKEYLQCIHDSQNDQSLASCVSNEYARFDGMVKKIYERLRKDLPRSRADELRREQQNWIEARIRRCNDIPQFEEHNQLSFEVRHAECSLLLTEKRWYKIRRIPRH